MIEKTKSKIKMCNSKFGGVITGFIITLLITAGFLFVRLIFYIERQFANSETSLRFDSLMDFLGFPLIVILIYLIILNGVIIDGNRLPDRLIQVSRNYNMNKNELHTEKVVKNLKFVIEDKLLVKMIIMYLIGLTLFLIGHGLHVGTNFLNKMAIESNIDTINPTFYQQIWNLDEIVSHWFLFSGLLILIFLIGYLNLKLPSTRKISSLQWFFVILATMVTASIWAVINVEGEYAWWGLISSIVIILYFSNKLRNFKNNLSFKKIANRYMIVCFIIMFFSFSICWFIGYFLVFGGFIQPSDLLKKLLSK